MDISQEIKEELNKIKNFKKQHENNKENFDELIEWYSEILELSYESNYEVDIKTVLNEFAGLIKNSIYKYDLLPHIDATIEIVQQRKKILLELEFLCLKAWLFFQNENRKGAIELLQEAQAKNKNCKDIKIRIKINIYLALIFKSIGWYDKAILRLNSIQNLFYNKESKLIRELATYYSILGNVYKESEYYSIIGNVYQESEKYEKALDCYEKSLFYYKILKHKKSIAKVHNNKGIVYLGQKKYKQALYYLNLALDVKNESDINNIATTLAVIGNVYLEQMELEKAEKNYQDSFEFRKNKQDIKGIIHMKNAFGRLYFKQKKYQECEAILKESEKDSEKEELHNSLAENYLIQEEFYEKTDDYKSAHRYGKKYREVNKKIQSKLYQEQLVLNDTFNRLREKELEIEKQKEKTSEVKHRIKNHFGVLNGLMEQLKRRNIEQSGIDKIETCINAMAALYDMLYEVNDLEPTANLGDFLEKLTMQVRDVHQNLEASSQRIIVKSNLDKKITLKAAACLELGLIVAEMMTNSYKYAFKNFDEDKVPLIIIELKKNDDNTMIILKVEDNGCGFQEEEMKKRPDSFGTTFIENYVEQLEAEIKWPKMNEKGACYRIIIPV